MTQTMEITPWSDLDIDQNPELQAMRERLTQTYEALMRQQIRKAVEEVLHHEFHSSKLLMNECFMNRVIAQLEKQPIGENLPELSLNFENRPVVSTL